MALFQVTCRESCYVDRIYEIEAETAEAAAKIIRESQGGAGEIVAEQEQGTVSFDGVIKVTDENGNECT